MCTSALRSFPWQQRRDSRESAGCADPVLLPQREPPPQLFHLPQCIMLRAAACVATHHFLLQVRGAHRRPGGAHRVGEKASGGPGRRERVPGALQRRQAVQGNPRCAPKAQRGGAPRASTLRSPLCLSPCLFSYDAVRASPALAVAAVPVAGARSASLSTMDPDEILGSSGTTNSKMTK